jgi:hypothetical protein
MFSVSTTGLDAALATLRRVPEAQRAVGEVYLSGARNQNLAQFHHDGTAAMPARNVFFLPATVARRIGALMKRGVEDVLRGRSSGMRQAMSDAAKEAAAQFQANIDRGQADSGKVAPLSQPYKKWKNATFGKRPILVATGEFYRAIRSRLVDER